MEEKDNKDNNLGSEELSPQCLKLHSEANEAQESFYEDPDTGLMVQTEFAHLERGYCCGSGCRHCPYNHENC